MNATVVQTRVTSRPRYLSLLRSHQLLLKEELTFIPLCKNKIFAQLEKEYSAGTLHSLRSAESVASHPENSKPASHLV